MDVQEWDIIVGLVNDKNQDLTRPLFEKRRPLCGKKFQEAEIMGRSNETRDFNSFAPRDFAEKRVLKLVEWFSGHCGAVKS